MKDRHGERQVMNGMFYINAPGETFSLKANWPGLCKKQVFILQGNMADYLCNLNNLRLFSLIEVEDRQRLDELFARLKALVSSGSHHLHDDISVTAYALITELGRVIQASHYPAQLVHIIQFIESRLDEPLTLPRISKEFHISTHSLNRVFQKHLNTTPTNYIISRRMARARHLIAMKEFTFKEIARECGYTRESFFSRVFKQRNGVSPNSYRRAILS